MSPSTTPTGLPLPEPGVPHVQLLGCQQRRAGIDVPYDAVRPLVPQAFELSGVLPGETVAILVWIGICERTVNATAVLGPSQLYQAFVFVYPKDESWTNTGFIDYYLLDPATDNVQLLAFLQNQSVPAVKAQISMMALPIMEGYSEEQWSVEAADWKTEFGFTRRPATNPQPDRTLGAHIWYGQNPIQRLLFSELEERTMSSSEGALIATGDGNLSHAVPGGGAPYLGGGTPRSDILYQHDGAWLVKK